MEASKKMSREQRRSQLLEVAYEIIGAEGTDALTLARVAEQAGVSKPIAYEHFGTRSGLLAALFREYDERQNAAMRAALEARGETTQDVAEILSAAYVDCVVSSPTCGAIMAALSGSGELEELLQGCRDSFLEDCRQALAPFAPSGGPSHAILVGVVGAAEFLSQAAAEGRLSRDEAVAALSRVMVGALGQDSQAG